MLPPEGQKALFASFHEQLIQGVLQTIPVERVHQTSGNNGVLLIAVSKYEFGKNHASKKNSLD